MRAQGRQALARKLAQTLAHLRRMYGRPRWRCWGKPVDVLVATILSQNTADANSSRAYKQLRRRFRTWQLVADAPTAEVSAAIRISGLSNIKAPRIQTILREIRSAAGRIDLGYLADLPPDQATRRLMSFHGVGPKTAACVLLFSLGMPVFPVDTHIERIARRLGLVAASLTAPRVQQALEPLIPPRSRYAMHVLLITHGRQTCRAVGPRCCWCDLLEMCPYGRRRAAAGEGQADAMPPRAQPPIVLGRRASMHGMRRGDGSRRQAR
jgi:endonuclease-3